MDLTLERIVMTEWMYVLTLVLVSIQAFGVGTMIGFLWIRFF